MKLVKEIRSKAGELHFRRWELFKLGRYTLCLHHILKADEDRHLHDHPWGFISLIIWGDYIEQTEAGMRWRGIGSIARLPASGKYHKVYSVRKGAWSLVLMGPHTHDWGYKTEDGWVGHERYRQLKHEGHWG